MLGAMAENGSEALGELATLVDEGGKSAATVQIQGEMDEQRVNGSAAKAAKRLST